MNIVFFICDALRASNLGCYGYNKETSPEIDKIAKKGMRFSNAFSNTNATDPSFITIFTGKHPISHGILHHGNEITEIEKSYTKNLIFLPEILHQHGFVTIGIDWLGRWCKRGYDFYGGVRDHFSEHKENNVVKNNKQRVKRRKKASFRYSSSVRKRHFAKFPWSLAHYNWYYCLPSFARGYSRSFLRFYNTKFQNISRRLKESPILSDSAGLSDLAIEYIQRFAKKKAFFLFVHYWDNHIPYTAPRSVVNDLLHRYDYPDTKVSLILKNLSGTTAEYLINRAIRGKTPDTIGQIMAYYDASIRYVDSNIGRIYKFLKEINILDNTLVIITSDHGESLLEHDIFFDHHGLYDPEIKIPLIISNPNIAPDSVCDEFVQHFDIVPTILDMLGINTDIKFDGDSLLKITKNEGWNRNFVFAQETLVQKKRMIRDMHYKYIQALDEEKCAYCQKYHCRGDEFYDLENDPEEKENIIHSPEHLRYKDELEKYTNSLDEPKEGPRVTFEDEKTVNKMLKNLGYL